MEITIFLGLFWGVSVPCRSRGDARHTKRYVYTLKNLCVWNENFFEKLKHVSECLIEDLKKYLHAFFYRFNLKVLKTNFSFSFFIFLLKKIFILNWKTHNMLYVFEYMSWQNLCNKISDIMCGNQFVIFTIAQFCIHFSAYYFFNN